MKRFLFVITAGISLSTFSQSLDFSKPIIVAHRGASKFAPENTLASVQKAYELGAHMVEMDVRQTKDGIFILMHDATVNRTTNGSGKVNTLTLKEIQKLDAGSHFSESFKGEKVPTLRETLQFMKGKLLPDIDFKGGNVKDLLIVMEEEGYLEIGKATFHCGNLKTVCKVMQETDQIMVRPSYAYGFGKYKKGKLPENPPIVNINWGDFSNEYVKSLQTNGMKAFVNCLRSGDKKENMLKALASGADFIQADNLDVLIPLAKAAGK